MNPPEPNAQPWHVIERSQEEVTSVWSFNTQREAVDAMTAQINQQAEHNQTVRDSVLQTQQRILGYHLADPVAPNLLRWSTFSVAKCTGSSICPACLGVRLLQRPTQPEEELK